MRQIQNIIIVQIQKIGKIFTKIRGLEVEDNPMTHLHHWNAARGVSSRKNFPLVNATNVLHFPRPAYSRQLRGQKNLGKEGCVSQATASRDIIIIIIIIKTTTTTTSFKEKDEIHYQCYVWQRVRSVWVVLNYIANQWWFRFEVTRLIASIKKLSYFHKKIWGRQNTMLTIMCHL